MGHGVRYGALTAVVVGLAIGAAAAGDFSYPQTRRDSVTDTYHGVVVSDPYRWLECDCPEVSQWLERQNEATDHYLDETPQWRAIAERLAVLTKVQSKEYSGFRHVGGRSFVLY